MFKAMLIAGAGGFIGTCLRYLVGKLAHYVFSSAVLIICSVCITTPVIIY